MEEFVRDCALPSNVQSVEWMRASVRSLLLGDPCHLLPLIQALTEVSSCVRPARASPRMRRRMQRMLSLARNAVGLLAATPDATGCPFAKARVDGMRSGGARVFPACAAGGRWGGGRCGRCMLGGSAAISVWCARVARWRWPRTGRGAGGPLAAPARGRLPRRKTALRSRRAVAPPARIATNSMLQAVQALLAQPASASLLCMMLPVLGSAWQHATAAHSRDLQVSTF